MSRRKDADPQVTSERSAKAAAFAADRAALDEELARIIAAALVRKIQEEDARQGRDSGGVR
jgi:hypothetical protein